MPFGASATLDFDEPLPRWSIELVSQICELGDLDAGWDSYNARPIDPQCALAAVSFVLQVLSREMHKPAVVPTSRGKIQLEWHRAGADLEIEFESSSKSHVFFEDLRTEEVWERSLVGNFHKLLPYIRRVAQQD